MSDQDFDIRRILKSSAIEPSNSLDAPAERHEVVMDMGRLIFMGLSLILVCVACFTGGFIIGKRQADAPSTEALTAEWPVDDLAAAVPGEEGSGIPDAAAGEEGQEPALDDQPPADGDAPSESVEPPAEPPEAVQAGATAVGTHIRSRRRDPARIKEYESMISDLESDQ